MSRLRDRPTYSNVTATLALFVALGGSSYAALKLPRNSVGSQQVRDRSLHARDLAPDAAPSGLRGPRGPEGPTGAGGPAGSTGPPGPRGSSNVIVAGGEGVALSTLPKTVVALENVPVGSYLVSSDAQVGDFTNGEEI